MAPVSPLVDEVAEIVNPPAVLLTTLLFSGYMLLIHHMIKLLTGNSLFQQHRDYFLWMSGVSSVLAWLLIFMNLFVASWAVQPENLVMQVLLYTPMFALLGPAVLLTRALLGTSNRLLKVLSQIISFPEIKPETLVYILIPLAAFGIAGGATWPEKLYWLFWASPLLLLSALQILWNEGTIFSGLPSGDWGRIMCAALAGIIVCNFVLAAYQCNGGIINSALHGSLFEQLGFAIFGLLCMQLGDIVAEKWRGTTRGKQFRKNSKFPIPVISRKN